jgi:hypothetical protein
MGSKQNNMGFEEGHRNIMVKSKVKAKLSLEQAMKAKRESRGIVLLFL